MFVSEFGENYGIASCYNGLKIGGGSYTLARIKLDKLAKTSNTLESYLNDALVNASIEIMKYMDERIRFLIEDVKFFESSFLVREKLIKMENFSAMFGLVGLAEAVNYFLKIENVDERFGSSKRGDEIGQAIIKKIDKLVKEHKNKYILGTDGNYLLHAQVGVETDAGTSPGCRIPIGDEPEIFDHIIQAAKYHKYFPSGIGDIFNFDETVKNNQDYVLDIIRGAFKNDLRYFSAYSTDCDVIRITGYLVKKSEIEKAKRGEQVLRDTVFLGKGAVDNSRIYDRKIRK
jgi:YjjI family glycine radical enzyme